MMNDNRKLTVAARALMALIFLVAGIRKLLTWSATVGYFSKLGLPLPEIVLTLTIALEIGGALALIAGWRVQLVALALGAFTLAAALVGHPFWVAESAQFNAQLNNFLKNIAMVGGFLMLAIDAGVRQARASAPQV